MRRRRDVAFTKGVGTLKLQVQGQRREMAWRTSKHGEGQILFFTRRDTVAQEGLKVCWRPDQLLEKEGQAREERSTMKGVGTLRLQVQRGII